MEISLFLAIQVICILLYCGMQVIISVEMAHTNNMSTGLQASDSDDGDLPVCDS